MCIPVSRRWVYQIIDRVEHGQLHIGVYAVNHRQATVGEIEQDCVLVGHPGRTDHPARGAVELESAIGIQEAMNTDSPRPPGPGFGEVRVGHVPRPFRSPHPLHPWVFIRPHAVGGTGGQDTGELVGEAILGIEQKHIGPVIEEPRPGHRVDSVSLPDTTRKEMKAAGFPDQTRVEDRPVAGCGVGRHDRLATDALRHRAEAFRDRGCHRGHAGRISLSNVGFGNCAVMIGSWKWS